MRSRFVQRVLRLINRRVIRGVNGSRGARRQIEFVILQRRGTTRGPFSAVHAGPQEALEANEEPCGDIRGRVSTRSRGPSLQARAIDLRSAQEASIDTEGQADRSELSERPVSCELDEQRPTRLAVMSRDCVGRRSMDP